MLLHNGNKYAAITIGHSVHLKECYENLKLVLDKIKYDDHEWTVCGDLKVISMILGGYKKFPCFFVSGIPETGKIIGSRTIGQNEIH